MMLFTRALFILVVLVSITSSFFQGPVPTYANYTHRGPYITCPFKTSLLYNGTTTYDSGPTNIFGADPFHPYIDSAYLCVIYVTTTRGPYNLLQTVTNWFVIGYWNYYRNTAIHQCNFSASIDIGYGNCTPRVWETAISQQLCICSTSNCTISFATCMSSVDATLSSPPSQLPILQPNLTESITCHDQSADYDIAHNRTPIYTGCSITSYTLGGADQVKCSNYMMNHTVLGSVWYDPVQGNYNQYALTEGTYEDSMSIVINYAINGWPFYQSATSIVVVLHTSYPYNWAICLCMTDNCNQDITTCTDGINFNRSILTYNGISPWNLTDLTSSTSITTTNINLSTLTSSSSSSSLSSTTIHLTNSSLSSTSVTSTQSSQLNMNSSSIYFCSSKMHFYQMMILFNLFLFS